MRVTYDTRVRPFLGTLALIVALGCSLAGCGSNLPSGIGDSSDSMGVIQGYIYAPVTSPEGGTNEVTGFITGTVTVSNKANGFVYAAEVFDVSTDATIPNFPSDLTPFDRTRLGYYRLVLPAGTYDSFETFLQFTVNPSPPTGTLKFENLPTEFSAFEGVTGTLGLIVIYSTPTP